MSICTRLVRIARTGLARLRVPVAALALAASQSLSPAPAWAGPVNINSADAATLSSELKGVGPVKAQRLIEYRQKHGPFRTLDDLALVKGFGQKLIERNRADLRLGGSAPATAAATRQAGAQLPAAGSARPGVAKASH
jgi:competence protein ComEA